MERTLCFGKGGYFRVHNESLPPRPQQGAAPRLIVRPGWWTFGRMESEMECDIVESPSSIPRDPIARQRPKHPRSKGSGSTPDLGHSGLGCRGQWRRCLAGVTKVSVKQSAVNCVIHWRHWLFITSTINTTVCCWSNFTADAYTGVLPDSFFLLLVHDCLTFKQWGIWTCAGIKKANAHLPWWPVG